MTDLRRFCQVKNRRKEIPGRWAAVCAQRRVSHLLSPDYGMSGGEGHSLRNETKEVGWAPTTEPRSLDFVLRAVGNLGVISRREETQFAASCQKRLTGETRVWEPRMAAVVS